VPEVEAKNGLDMSIVPTASSESERLSEDDGERLERQKIEGDVSMEMLSGEGRSCQRETRRVEFKI